MKSESVNDGNFQEMFFRRLKGGHLPVDLLTIGGDSGVPDRLTSLLREKMPYIAGSIPDGAMIACIGVSDGENELIMASELAGKIQCEFRAIGAGGGTAEAAIAKLAGAKVKAAAFAGFLEDLPKLRDGVCAPLVISCLGNSFSRREPEQFLSLIRESLQTRDFFLFDCHLFDSGESRGALPPRFPGSVLSPESVAFREDILPAATPAGEAYRARSVLQMRQDCQLSVDGGTVQLKKGEEIELGFTYKYKLSQVVTLLKRLRFQIVRLFLSDDNNDLIVLVQPQEAGFLKHSMLER